MDSKHKTLKRNTFERKETNNSNIRAADVDLKSVAAITRANNAQNSIAFLGNVSVRRKLTINLVVKAQALNKISTKWEEKLPKPLKLRIKPQKKKKNNFYDESRLLESQTT